MDVQGFEDLSHWLTWQIDVEHHQLSRERLPGCRIKKVNFFGMMSALAIAEEAEEEEEPCS